MFKDIQPQPKKYKILQSIKNIIELFSALTLTLSNGQRVGGGNISPPVHRCSGLKPESSRKL